MSDRTTRMFCKVTLATMGGWFRRLCAGSPVRATLGPAGRRGSQDDGSADRPCTLRSQGLGEPSLPMDQTQGRAQKRGCDF